MLQKYRFLFSFLILSVIVTGFIFNNSLQDSQTSNDLSRRISEVIQPLLDPQGKYDEMTFHVLTRKLAHGAEFFILGCCITGLLYGKQSVHQHNPLFMILFFLLSIAVIDEYIQSFTGRTSAVTDILIDFGGALLGVILVIVIITIHRKIQKTPTAVQKNQSGK